MTDEIFADVCDVAISEREQERELRQVASECDLYGHDYEVLEGEPMFVAGPRDPEEVFCPRCGKSWKVER